ncbi:hypothetical protein EGJ52_20030 [Pseudomonas luteola]|jgi:hypothetical protein|nr:hypothetical protein EGJ52_20030 [Pseudomonas luteola]
MAAARAGTSRPACVMHKVLIRDGRLDLAISERVQALLPLPLMFLPGLTDHPASNTSFEAHRGRQVPRLIEGNVPVNVAKFAEKGGNMSSSGQSGD